MSKCFITKLPSSVDNDNLPVLGQLRIKWLKQDSLTDNDARAFSLNTNDTITVKVSGAHFTDSTLSANNGNSKTIKSTDGQVWLYVSNDADAVLTIDGKYSLTSLNFVKPTKGNLARSVYFDIEEVKYLTALGHINLANTQVSGDISAIANLTALGYIDLSYTQVSGDISAIANLTALGHINLANTQVSGDISAIANLTALKAIFMANTPVSGDISAIANLTALGYIDLSYTQVSGDISAIANLTALGLISLSNTQVSGKVDSLSRLTNLTYLADLRGLSLTGDMSKMPANVMFISQMGRKVNDNFTWTAKGRQNATLLAMEGPIPFDTASMDNMLIDQATCTVSPRATDPWQKKIVVKGTRTSSSDAAITAVQNKGITITGVIKQA